MNKALSALALFLACLTAYAQSLGAAQATASPSLPTPVAPLGNGPAQPVRADGLPPPVPEGPAIAASAFLGDAVSRVLDDKGPVSDLTKKMSDAERLKISTELGKLADESHLRLGVVIMDETPVDSLQDAARDRLTRWYAGNPQSGVLVVSLSQKKAGIALGSDFAQAIAEEPLRAAVTKVLLTSAQPGPDQIASAIAQARNGLPIDPAKYGKVLASAGIAFFIAGLGFFIAGIRVRRAAVRAAEPYLVDLTPKHI